MSAPTVEQMRSHVCSMAHLVGRGAAADGEMFDQVIREVKAQAWDEGRKAQPVYDPKARYTTWPDNPYRLTSSEVQP